MSFFDLPPIIERMLLVSDKISDLNFSVGQLPQVEINGKLTPVQPLGMQKLTPYQTEIIAMALMHGNPDAAERLAHTGTADLSYSLPSRARFRVNIFQQRGVYSIVMRVIPTDIPTVEIARASDATRGNCRTEKWFGLDDWTDRLRQKFYSSCDHRHHQREEALPCRNHRRSDRISSLAQELDHQSTRSRPRHQGLSLSLASNSETGAKSDPHRRNARF